MAAIRPATTRLQQASSLAVRDAGRINPASAICLLDLAHIPDGLNAAEPETYLREYDE
jgi:hypothetical protein